MEQRSSVNGKNVLKFLLFSAFGVLMFLVPIPQGDSFTTLLDFLKTGLKNLFGGSLNYILLVLLIISAVVSLIDYFAKPDFIRNNHYLKRAFSTTPLYLVSKVFGAIFGIMVILGFGPEVVTSADTGATIIDLYPYPMKVPDGGRQSITTCRLRNGCASTVYAATHSLPDNIC